jgi:phage shock protein A
MGKMLDNFRSWWNSVADSLGDPGKLAQLSVADLEKSIVKAKEAAAVVVGRPVALESRLKELNKSDKELTDRIKALVATGEQGKEAARKYVERQVAVRKEIAQVTEDYADAKAASEQWQDKIRVLENELYSRRSEADRLQMEYETAKAEQRLGKQMASADALAGTDLLSGAKARIDKEKAKAAGYSAMSGLSDKAAEEKLLRDAETDALFASYLNEDN